MTMATVFAADSMSMTTIWYFAAATGSAPASSWPVIMPGNVTMPAADMFASTGVMPAPMAALSDGAAASPGVAPSATSENISSARASRSEKRRSTATATDDMALPMIMPTMGITCRALYHGSAWMTPSTTMKPMAVDDTSSDKNTERASPGMRFLTRDVAIWVAATTMAASTSPTSHHVWYSNRYVSRKPAARSCTKQRTDDTAMRRVCPSSSFHDTRPATSMSALAANSST